jgi:hypothetical protein
MHDEHDHHYDHGHHHHGHDRHGHHPHANGHGHPHPPGHNGPSVRPVQWQTPHLADAPEPPADEAAADLDLVEAAFVEGFSRASDVASFLRLAGIPFVGETLTGTRLHLLRVETDEMVDVGSVMPLVGGAGVTYHPLPSRLTSRRRRLAFVYHDGKGAAPLSFAEARALTDQSRSSQLLISS